MVPYKDGYARPSVREGCAGQARHTTSPANQEAVESLESWEPRAPLTLVLVAIATSDLQAQAQAQDAGAGIRCPIKCWYSSANSREPLSLCQRQPPLTADYDLLPSAYYLRRLYLYLYLHTSSQLLILLGARKLQRPARCPHQWAMLCPRMGPPPVVSETTLDTE